MAACLRSEPSSDPRAAVHHVPRQRYTKTNHNISTSRDAYHDGGMGYTFAGLMAPTYLWCAMKGTLLQGLSMSQAPFHKA